ncbi:P-type DNA transfer ATPase VirB11 [Legionella feeleii]|uniref:Type IV secretion system protein n=1 Tax=Legionella feeleii TaxID=453 RepID=A0A378KNI4_9GAMM|nr:P-type DNA transfer ATPase VirB11 [Legionella feeleii]STX88330.1 protein LvhB11 [Legionella feeleii]
MSLALNAYLAPLTTLLEAPEVSELCINRPGEVWLETQGQFHCTSMPTLTERRLLMLAKLLAEDNGKTLSPQRPLLSATLPDGQRCQMVLPPACVKGQLICAIRKPTVASLTLEDWEARGAFTRLGENRLRHVQAISETLAALRKKGCFKELIRLAVKSKLTILISGGTSTAKTTFLNSCLKEIPPSERLITIEGVREVQPANPNCVHLLANEDEASASSVSMLDLLKVSLRLRPDRLFVSELRAAEAYPFLRACLSGHPGSLTTLHADSIDSALTQLKFMLAESPALQGAASERLDALINASVQVVVQMARRDNGARVIEDIHLLGVQ